MSRLSDPSRQAHLERVLEKRRREGRSSISRSGSDASAVLGNVVPAQFPPNQTQSPHHQQHSPQPQYNTSGYGHGQGGQGGQGIPDRLSQYADQRDNNRAGEQRRAKNLAVEEDELDRQRRELLMVKAETKRELEVQRAIAAESENELRWQQQRLEEQLDNEREIGDKWQRVQDRLKVREQRTATQEDMASRRLDAKDDEITRRLREREGSQQPDIGGGGGGGATPEVYRAMQQQIQDLERKVSAAMVNNSPASMRGPSVDPYDVQMRADSPHSQTTAGGDTSYMKPGHSRHAPTGDLYTNPPPVPRVSQEDPIFSKHLPHSHNPSPTDVFSNPNARPGYYAPPSTLLNRTEIPYTRAIDRVDKDPVWEGSGGMHDEAADSYPPRYDHGPSQGGYYPSDRPINASGYPRGRTSMPQGGALREASGSGSVDAIAERTYHHTMGRANNASQNVSNHNASGTIRNPSPQRTRFETMQQPQSSYVHNAPINQAMRREAILHDMKSGDWFVKWTKNDKPHRRWFYLNQKKMLLVWANTQTASILMSNNICLQEVVSIRPEQLTEESPGNPGHPQVCRFIFLLGKRKSYNLADVGRNRLICGQDDGDRVHLIFLFSNFP